MAVWPTTLPQKLLIAGLQETLAAPLRTQMDAGPAKQRRRFTAAPRALTGSIVVDATQWATFRTFYETTLENGALSFDWVEPGTSTPATLRFTAPPTRTAISKRHDQVSMALEILP